MCSGVKTIFTAQARELLEAVASQVQPILRRRKWTVPLLSEFYPQQRNLLVRTPVHSVTVALHSMCPEVLHTRATGRISTFKLVL
jgi:hypothetical protein